MTSVDIRHGDCLTVLRDLPANSVDSVVTDPPYGLSNTKPQQVADVLAAWVTGDTVSVPAKRGGFMGKDWDSFVPPPAVWEECLRVLKPGGHMAVFAGARTQDLMGLSIRLAGFEIRDTLGWIYGCLSEDTEVLINGEWVQYHKAKVGDLALCYNKEYDTYEWQPIEDTHKYEYGDTAYRIRSNKTDQLVSRNHRVLVERGGTYEFEFAENLAREHEIRVPVLENVRALLDDLSVRESLSSDEEPVLQRELRSIRPSTGCGEAGGSTRNDRDCVRCVRDEGVQAGRLVEADENSDVLTRVQREVALGEVEGARTQGSSGVVRGDESSVRGESARGEQPGLERRRHSKAGARELQGCSVCAVPAGAYEHGTQGRVCDGAPASGGPGYRATPVADGSCASCESHAGGQSVGEPVSVCIEPGSQAVRGARYTVADLASIEPVHYEGVVWCLTVPTGAFVVRRNGKVFVTGNSGFPKSMDVSKAIDKHAQGNMRRAKLLHFIEAKGVDGKWLIAQGVADTKSFADWTIEDHSPSDRNWAKIRDALGVTPEEEAEFEREVIGKGKSGKTYGMGGLRGVETSTGDYAVTVAVTEAAKRYEGVGTALKPAIEPIILARKPLDGTVAQNVLEHGVGGLNIDACRVPARDDRKPVSGFYNRSLKDRQSMPNDRPYMDKLNPDESGAVQPHPAGRFPANVLLDEHAAKEMDRQSGVSVSRANTSSDGRGAEGSYIFASSSLGRRDPSNSHNDSGGASRFFPVFKYQAKAPKKERPVIERPPMLQLRDDLTPEQVDHVRARLQEAGIDTH